MIKNLECKPKTNKKIKITATENIISQMITQDSRMYKFIQFKFHKAMCDYFNKIREIKREPELKTLELWISGLMLNPLFFLISRAANFRVVDIGINA